jgi:hypothetical protein
MAIGTAVAAAAGKGGIANLIFGAAQSGASGGNQDTSDPYAGGILSRIGGWTADPQTFFSLPRKIRAAKRSEKMADLSLLSEKERLKAMQLVNAEEERKQNWNNELRKRLLRGGY